MRLVALLALCAAVFFVGLGAYDLDTKGEPREGVTAWEIVHSGEWALPHLNGEVLPEKPLVFPWLVAVSTLALGEGGELAPRLPSALMACGLVLLVHALGRRLLQDGMRPAVICATTFLVVSLARRARVDMTLAFFVTLALLQFLRAIQRPRTTTILVFWLALALGTLTKGPVGAVLPLLAGGTYLLWEGRLAALRPFVGTAWVFVLVAGSWYANGLLRERDAFAYRSFLMENVLMYVGAEKGGGHIHGTFYYFQYLPSHAAPWSLYLPAALALAWKRRGDSATRFVLAWAGSLFVFFSIARGKRADYLLPLMPAFALLVARLWREGSPAALRASSGVGAVLAVAGFAAYPFVHERLPVTLGWPVFAGVALLALAPPLLLLGERRRAALASIAGGSALLAMAVSIDVMPHVQKTRPFVEAVAGAAGDAPLVQSGVFDFTTLYYLRRRIPTVDHAGVERTLERGGWAIVSRDEWAALAKAGHARIAAVTSDRLLVGQKMP